MKKRFRLQPNSNQLIWDTKTGLTYVSVDAKRLIKLLNELNDSIEKIENADHYFKFWEKKIETYRRVQNDRKEL